MIDLGDNILKQQIPQAASKSVPADISVTWRAITHQGLVRQQNEDSLCVETETKSGSASRYLFAVADGLGGHGGGDIASKLALKSVINEFHSWNGVAADRLLDRALRNANQEVFSEAQSQSQFSKMQTTLTAIALEQGSLTVGHVGDCRLYRERDGHVELLTRDHSMANELLKMHLITPEQACQHPGRHQLVRSIGAEPFLRTDIIREQIISDDTYLLCSDGLWGEVTEEDIKAAMQESNVGTACEKLVRIALKAGAPDNISAIVFRVATAGKKATSQFSWRAILRKR